MLRMAVAHAPANHSEYRTVRSLKRVRETLKSLKTRSPLVRSLLNASSLERETRHVAGLVGRIRSGSLSVAERRFLAAHDNMLEHWLTHFSELVQAHPDFVSRKLAGDLALTSHQKGIIRDVLRRARALDVFPDSIDPRPSSLRTQVRRRRTTPEQVAHLVGEDTNAFDRVESVYKDALLLNPRLVRDLWPEFHDWVPPLLTALGLRSKKSPFSFDHFHDFLEYALAYHHREARRVARPVAGLPVYRLADRDLAKLSDLLLAPSTGTLHEDFRPFVQDLARSPDHRRIFLSLWPHFGFKKPRNKERPLPNIG